jgi:RHS repeat-associated protein
VIEAANESAHVFPLAALPLFAEKPHPGHHAPSSTFRPGALLAISNTATALPVCLYDSAIRSCCSSKERDAETGLDYFGARYMSSAQGRFTSPDPVWVTPERILDPQQLNLYAYVRNNPLRYVDPDGTILELAASGEEDAKKKFALIQRGLTKQDQGHVQLVVGNGKNGFAAGHFGITADSDYKSDSGNFQILQGTANSKDLAIAAIVGPGDKFASNIGVQKDGTVVIVSFKSQYGGQDNYVSSKDAVPGQTLFQLFGSPQKDVFYSPDQASRFYVANDESALEIVKTFYHELSHVYLGDFGRSVQKGSHPNADKEIRAVEKEAERNFGGPARKQQ